MDPIQSKNINKQKNTQRLISALLALYWVIFMWGFWSKGVYSLGINAFLFWIFALGALFWTTPYRKNHTERDLSWIIPLILIAISFLIYENPFLKSISILLYPLLIILFFNFGSLNNKWTRRWNPTFTSVLFLRIVSFVEKIGISAKLYLHVFNPRKEKQSRALQKTIIGVLLFFVVALVIFVPLLSSADPTFAKHVSTFYSWLGDFFAASIFSKIIVFILLAVLFLSVFLAWVKDFDYQEEASKKVNIDSIISGIVLGGILLLYLLFILIQFERLWVGTLPFDFKATENLVKSGFWQLLILSLINIGIYLTLYKKTIKPVQWILTAFTVASLLLLVSAGYRMTLYVTVYGFSYEKFFASYTVVYCAILFLWLFSRLFVKQRADAIKFMLFLFLWMFSLVTIFPVEQFILRSNISLMQREESRIKLPELTMLSADVLDIIETREKNKVIPKNEYNWQPWIKKQKDRIEQKAWYEKNIINVLYLSKSR